MTIEIKGLERAKEIIEAYEALVARALEIVSEFPFMAYVDDSHGVVLSLDGENAVLTWCEYESDYYGGGHLDDQSTSFPAVVLVLSDEGLKSLRAEAKREQERLLKAEEERQRKVKEAQAIIAAQRKEAHDRAEYARLTAKYGAKK